jgi:hypothetical protein
MLPYRKGEHAPLLFCPFSRVGGEGDGGCPKEQDNGG